MIETVVVFGVLMTARVAAFVAMLPLLGGTSMPHTVKIGLTMALTVLWSCAFWEQMSGCAWLGAGGAAAWLGFGLAVGREILLGAIVGYMLGLVLIPARVAGDFLAQEMGLSFGNMVSVSGNGESTPLTVIFEMLAAALFLGLDGHHGFFGVMQGLMERYPVGGSLPAVPAAGLVHGVLAAEEWGLMLAAPVALCLFLTTIVLTLMARATPQLNLYTVGFPLRLGVGLVAVLVLLPQGVATLVSIFGHAAEMTGWILN